MNLQFAGSGDARERAAALSARLRGYLLLLARAAWVSIALLAMGSFVASVPSFYSQAVALSGDVYGSAAADSETVRGGLAQLGLSAAFYGGYLTALLIAFAAAFCAVGAIIFWRRSNGRMALFVSLWLVVFGTTFTPVTRAAPEGSPAFHLLAGALSNLSFVSFFVLLYLFPSGRFVPRWTRWPAVLFATIAISASLFPGSPLDLNTWPFLLGMWVFLGLVASMLYAQVHRFQRVSGPIERQQTKWAVFGFAVAAVAFALAGVVDQLLSSLSLSDIAVVVWELVFGHILVLGFLVVPLSISIAVLRCRLWDIDLVINRTLVYSTLTVSVVGLYVLIVGGLGTLLQAQGNHLVPLVATGLVALLFAPLRDRLQRGVNRLVYGERDDPYAVLSRLGRRLEATLDPQAVLPAIVETVAQALKLPYAAVALIENREPDEFVIAAEVGDPVHPSVHLPLVYQHELVGQLLVAPHAGEEGFSSADRRLLADLARQAGVAAHAVRLTADLQRARQRLVAAREEERRRLRRDLHDGLGPQLSSQMLTIGAVRALMRQDPDSAEALLLELKAQARDAISDIRRLVYGLRPPALDDLGFVGALRETAAQYGRNGLSVSVEAPERLPDLPAAVEVAAYRIAQEALTNAARHAQAHGCLVSLEIEEARTFRLQVRDDGRGIVRGSGSGVGLSSMRERAEELGGNLTIEALPEGGTIVRATLPLPEEG